MAISQYRITNGEWTPISTAGQSGTAWIEQVFGSTDGRCRIWHGVSLPDSSRLTHGFKMLYSDDNRDAVQLTADSASDVFYARSDSSTSAFVINVDMV